MKDNTQHTPGPWFYDTGTDGAVIYCKDGTIARTTDDMTSEKANTRLIAAAPELLEALDEAQAWFEDYCLDYDIDPDSKENTLLQKVRAARAKAQGQS